MNELFKTVLNVSFQGSIVIAIVLLLRLALRKVPKKYICLLWILAGIRLLIPFQLESPLSLQPEVPQIMQVYTEAQPQPEIPEQGMVTAVPDNVELPNDVEIVYDDANNISENVEPERHLVIDWYAICAVIWLSVAGAMAIYSLVSYWLLKRRVREAVHLFDNVWECAGLDTAFILGLARPWIYIPAGIREGSCRFILEHEQAHLSRGDHWLKLAGLAALIVHWFNPLVWLAYALLCRDMEMACDEQVIRYMGLEERKKYSTALLECSTNRTHWAACPVAFGEVSVKQRIMSVLNYRRPAFWFSVVAIIAIFFVTACFLTNPSDGIDGIPETHEEWEAECRAVLEEIQSRDYYHILEDRQFEGEYILNDSCQRNAFRSGDTWLRIDYIEDSYSFSGYMGIQGQYFEAVSDEARFEWQEVDMTEDAIFDPWLYSFDIDAQKVTANAMWTDDGGYYIRLMVYAPYDNGGWLNAESYYVDFGFDSEGNFRHAIQYVNTTNMIDGKLEDHSMVVTMYAPDIPEVDIQSTILEYAGDVSRDYDIFLGVAELDEDVPNWVTLLATEVTSHGMTLVCEQHASLFPGMLTTGRHYWIEKWEKDVGWVALETIGDSVWPMDAYVITQGGTSHWDLNWVWLYGQLQPGSYRLGKNISFDPALVIGADITLSDAQVEAATYPFYARFEIEEDTTNWDAEGELARCEEALKAFQAQESYCLMTTWDIKEPGSDFGTMTTQLFYKAGEDWMRQSLSNTAGLYHLERDGVLYQRVVENVPESQGDSGWVQAKLEKEEDFMPWLDTFRWDRANVEHVQSYWPERDVVSFVLGAESYNVTFDFVPGTNTLKTVYLNYVDDGVEIAAVMTPQTGVDAAAEIERVYTQEIARN